MSFGIDSLACVAERKNNLNYFYYTRLLIADSPPFPIVRVNARRVLRQRARQQFFTHYRTAANLPRSITDFSPAQIELKRPERKTRRAILGNHPRLSH